MVKTKSAKRRLKVAHANQHFAPTPAEWAEIRLRELQSQLMLHHHNLAQLYAFACGEKPLQSKRCAKKARNYQRTPADDQRLLGTASNLQAQITQLNQEFSQLLRGVA